MVGWDGMGWDERMVMIVTWNGNQPLLGGPTTSGVSFQPW